MRQGQQNRRGRGRGGRKPQDPLSRNYESSGPEVKVHGSANHIAEKYMALARDAQSLGDIIAAENYLQHAEHYNRIIMAAQTPAAPMAPASPHAADTFNPSAGNPSAGNPSAGAPRMAQAEGMGRKQPLSGETGGGDFANGSRDPRDPDGRRRRRRHDANGRLIDGGEIPRSGEFTAKGANGNGPAAYPAGDDAPPNGASSDSRSTTE